VLREQQGSFHPDRSFVSIFGAWDVARGGSKAITFRNVALPLPTMSRDAVLPAHPHRRDSPRKGFSSTGASEDLSTRCRSPSPTAHRPVADR
jgi:hypothetical protein